MSGSNKYRLIDPHDGKPTPIEAHPHAEGVVFHSPAGPVAYVEYAEGDFCLDILADNHDWERLRFEVPIKESDDE